MCLQTRDQLQGEMVALEESIQEQLEEKLSAVAQAFQPTFGDAAGRCYSCGQNNPMSPSKRSSRNRQSGSFAQMPSRDVMSPSRSAGGGFRGVASPKSSRSMHKNNTMSDKQHARAPSGRMSMAAAPRTSNGLIKSDSQGTLPRKSSKGKVQVKTGPVKLPDIASQD